MVAGSGREKWTDCLMRFQCLTKKPLCSDIKQFSVKISLAGGGEARRAEQLAKFVCPGELVGQET